MTRFLLCIILAFALLLGACAPQATAPLVQQVGERAVSSASTPNVIFITPTSAPTLIPTVELFVPSATPTQTPTITPTPEVIALEVQCDTDLTRLYTQASEACLGKPSDFFCNGGLPPRVEPSGAIANSLASVGALVEATVIDSVRPLPLHTSQSGGLVWLHLREKVTMNALLIGDVHLRDVTPPESTFPKWQLFTIETVQHESLCPNTPQSTFIVQGVYGVPTAFVLNGISVDLNGTLAIQTSPQTTHFIALEGLVRLTSYGESRSLFPGQQLDVRYPTGDWTQPSPPLSQVSPLNNTLIAHLPVVIMDRPVLLPQGGTVQTSGMVNMRTSPNQQSAILYQVPAGEVMSVLGKNSAGDWLHIRLGNGETGWMKADLLSGVLGEIAVSYEATPVPPQRLGALGSYAKVIASQGGNLRTAPDITFNAITTLPAGTEVEIIARSPYSPFVKVRANGIEGWIALITLETQSVVGFLPVDYSVPLPARPTAVPVFEYGGGHAYPNPNAGN